MKTCIKCFIKKPIKEFYSHPQMKDGRLNKCKFCARTDAENNRSKNIEYYLQYDKDRANLPKRILARKEYSKTKVYKISHSISNNRYRKSEKGKLTMMKYKERNREHINARAAVKYAINSGKIKRKPCEICNKRKNIQAHHDDYSQPLAVRWLCASCHYSEHKKIKEKIL